LIGWALLSYDTGETYIGTDVWFHVYDAAMRITVDRDRCEGHGRCYDLAAELFRPDDEGHALLVDSGGAVPPEHEAKAVAAVRNCPEQALALDS
jgi:ferredoxin